MAAPSARLLAPAELFARRARARRRAHRQRLGVLLGAAMVVLIVTVALVDGASADGRLNPTAVTAVRITPPAARTTEPASRTVTSSAPASHLGIPAVMLAVYRQAGAATGVPWQELAAIGHNESDDARSDAPGVRSGVNYADCCSGPAQLCVMAACGEVWQRYGAGDVYDPLDAFEAAGRYLHDLAAAVGPRLDLQLAAYNAGPGAVARFGGVPPYEQTMTYVTRGVAFADALGGHTGAR